MPVSAAIKFTQGATTDLAGRAVIGATAVAVVMTNGDNSDGFDWTWELLTKPSASVIPTGVIAAGAVISASFTPDVVGSYLGRLTVKDTLGNQAVDERAFIVPEVSGRIIPPFRGDSASLNYGGQVEGWDPAMEAWLKFLDTRASRDNPTITGTVTHQGTLQRILSIPGEVQTTNATVTTVASFSMLDETLAAFDVVVTAAQRTNVTKGGRWKRSVVYRRTGAGIATIVGALESGTDEETDAALDVTIDTDGANLVRVRVTGIAATNFNWTCELRVQETLAT